MPKLTEYRDNVPKAALPREVHKWDEDHFPIYTASKSFWYREDDEGIYHFQTYTVEDGHVFIKLAWTRSDREGEKLAVRVAEEIAKSEDRGAIKADTPEELESYYRDQGFSVDDGTIYKEVS